MSDTLFKRHSEDEIVKQLIESMKKSDMGATTPANVVTQKMREKYTIIEKQTVQVGASYGKYRIKQRCYRKNKSGNTGSYQRIYAKGYLKNIDREQ